MSDHRYGCDMGLPPFQPSTATDSRPPVPFSALSASDAGRRRGGAWGTSSGELQPVRVPFKAMRGSRDSTVSGARSPVPSSGVPHAQSAGHRSLSRVRLTGSMSPRRGPTGLAAAAVALAPQLRVARAVGTENKRALFRLRGGTAVHGKGLFRSLSVACATLGVFMRVPMLRCPNY